MGYHQDSVQSVTFPICQIDSQTSQVNEYATFLNQDFGIPVYAVYKLTPTEASKLKTSKRLCKEPWVDKAGWFLSSWPRVTWAANTVALHRPWPVERLRKPDRPGMLKGGGICSPRVAIEMQSQLSNV